MTRLRQTITNSGEARVAGVLVGELCSIYIIMQDRRVLAYDCSSGLVREAFLPTDILVSAWFWCSDSRNLWIGTYGGDLFAIHDDGGSDLRIKQVATLPEEISWFCSNTLRLFIGVRTGAVYFTNKEEEGPQLLWETEQIINVATVSESTLYCACADGTIKQADIETLVRDKRSEGRKLRVDGHSVRWVRKRGALVMTASDYTLRVGPGRAREDDDYSIVYRHSSPVEELAVTDDGSLFFLDQAGELFGSTQEDKQGGATNFMSYGNNVEKFTANDRFVVSVCTDGQTLSVFDKKNEIPERQIELKPSKRPSKTTTKVGKALILHISDFHFRGTEGVPLLAHSLLRDVNEAIEKEFAGARGIDAIIVSGDVANQCSVTGYEQAIEFLDSLKTGFGLSSREQIMVVPGNHDVDYATTRASYHKVVWEPKPENDTTSFAPRDERDVCHIPLDKAIYARRFRSFSENFYKPWYGQEYPEDEALQFRLSPLVGVPISILGLNSAVRIDHLSDHKERIGISVNALAKAFGTLGSNPVRLLVWHHPIIADRSFTDRGILKQFNSSHFAMGFHGDSHHPEDSARSGFTFLGAGTISTDTNQYLPGVPRAFNLVRLDLDERAFTTVEFTSMDPQGVWDWKTSKPRRFGR